jgi:hypothetical protein
MTACKYGNASPWFTQGREFHSPIVQADTQKNQANASLSVRTICPAHLPLFDHSTYIRSGDVGSCQCTRHQVTQSVTLIMLKKDNLLIITLRVTSMT